MANSHPPQEVPIEFLHNLSQIVQAQEPVVLVLRGSLLLRHWYGESARLAADIDFECFHREPPPSRHGPPQRFTSLVDFGRGLCCFAAERTQYHPSAVETMQFFEIDVPEGGNSLWTYGSPGERFYVGWTWHGRGGQTGQLQIDIAESGSYALNDIDVAEVTLVSANASIFRWPAYTPEMMLAAKLSWLVRSFKRRTGEVGPRGLSWTGEPKDLFDTYLLLTRGNIRADAFLKSLLAVGADDELDWNSLLVLFDVRKANLSDETFVNWPEFHRQHQALIDCSPGEMLQRVIDRLEPLLGDFYLPDEMPFILAINADPVDELSYLVYADWLEERGDARSTFLRLYSLITFRGDELPKSERTSRYQALQDSVRTTSAPWLHQLFGTSARFQAVRQRIDGYAI